MTIAYDRSICCDLDETISREWLVTNGLGGYASGTIAGVLTRMEHGLLVASLPETSVPQLLFAKVDEEIVFDQRTYFLGTNEYRDGTLNPAGFFHLETFRLEEGFPVFTYHIGGLDGIMLEKRIWMPQGQNTTYVQYRVLRTAANGHAGYGRGNSTGPLNLGYGRYYEYAETTQRALTFTLLPFAAYRPFNRPQYGKHDWHFHMQQHRTEQAHRHAENAQPGTLPAGVVGCTMRAWEGAHPYHVLAVASPESHVTFIPTNVWYWNFLHRYDAAMEKPATDDLYLPGVIRATLWPGENTTLTLILSSEELATHVLNPQQLARSFTQSVEKQAQLLTHGPQSLRYFGEGGEAAQAYPLFTQPLLSSSDTLNADAAFLRLLLQAGSRFLAQRAERLEPQSGFAASPSLSTENSPLIFSDYYSLEMRTRDALIALPGLLLATQQYGLARRLLRELAQTFKQGMLPEYLPASKRERSADDYRSVDLLLWYIVALDAYLRATHDTELLSELYHHLLASLHWYIRGNDAGIVVDAQDGLLSVQAGGRALTWMNALVDGSPVTPRFGKAVEVNALWYHALARMLEWSRQLHRMGHPTHFPVHYRELLERCQQTFPQRFWYQEGHYLYDVIDGPLGNDSSIRPNQVLACSLQPCLLSGHNRKNVLDVVAHHLLTPYGLRTLAPSDAAYQPTLGVLSAEQQAHLHQGSVWTWLLGPYIDALLAKDAQPAPAGGELVHEYMWRKGLKLLMPLQERFYEGMQGMCSGIFDGEAPHHAGYCAASALATGELMRLYAKLVRMQTTPLVHALFA